jgi:hypothetical protein
MKQEPSRTEAARLRLNTSPAVAAAHRASLQEEAAAKRSAKAIESAHREQWKQVLEPLRLEILRVNGCIHYQGATLQERSEALSFYHEVLLTLRDRLLATANPLDGNRQTPLHAAIAKNIPNEGLHWTDWVPQKIRARVEAAFAAVPYKPRARTVKPFKRTITKARHALLLGALRKKTTASMDNLQRMQNIREDDERTQELEHMRQALQIMDNLPSDSPVPRDWRKLEQAVAEPGLTGVKNND